MDPWTEGPTNFEPSIRERLRILADACGGLHAAHELRGKDGAPLGVVHRDISPQNILQNVQRMSAGVKFGKVATVNVLAQADSPETAQLLGNTTIGGGPRSLTWTWATRNQSPVSTMGLTQ